LSSNHDQCVVVNDASCLIDLRKGRLLHVVLKLPYRFVIPLPVRHSELLDFTSQEWQFLEDGGMETFDLPAELVTEAYGIKAEHAKLSANDCFCLVATRCRDNALLLTGDGLLRRVAGERGLRVHGVLWVIDELKAAACCADELLISALKLWKDDKAVFLPDFEINSRLKSLGER
jgi:predicted nucleic acid-binding protein